MTETLNELCLPNELLTDDGNRRPLAYLDAYEEEHVDDGLSLRVAHEKEDLYYHSLLRKRISEVKAGSTPQSTLCDVESCRVKPRFPPHATALQHLSSDDAWNLLCSQIQTPTNQRVYARMASAGWFYPNPSLAQHKLRMAQLCHLRRQQLIKQQLSPAWRSQNRDDYVKAKGTCYTHVGFSSLSVSPPPVHKPQPGSGMRAVFLNPRKESSGTGVFLPRQAGGPSEPREKPACSTALLPARVVQALNLDPDELGIHPPLPTHDLGLARNHKRSSSRPPPTSADARLPQEWTY